MAHLWRKIAVCLGSIATIGGAERHANTLGVAVVGLSDTSHVRFVVLPHGLRFFQTNEYNPSLGSGELRHDTLATSTYLSMYGLGDVRIFALDSTVELTFRIKGLYGSITGQSTVTATQIEILHDDPAKAFAVRAVRAAPDAVAKP
jgi:hypothetical protein